MEQMRMIACVYVICNLGEDQCPPTVLRARIPVMSRRAPV